MEALMKKIVFVALFMFSIVPLVSAWELETISDRNARHQSEEYQARQDAGTYQIESHRVSTWGDSTTRQDLNRYER
jgi:hypothetical protein